VDLLTIPFGLEVIDPHPLTGAECCTDVLAVGDINGDGRPDIVLGAQESKEFGLVWYENPSWRRHGISRGEFTTDGKIADLDGDGDQDIVVGEFKTGLTWYENLDEGLNWTPHLIGTGYIHDIEIGDLDGDGHADVLTCDKKELVLWQRSPSGWTRTSLLKSEGEGLAIADIDKDSDLDIIFGANWFENTGHNAAQWPQHVISSDWPASTRARVADMNSDGRADVVLTASEGIGRVSWFDRPPKTGVEWQEHSISRIELEGVHSLIASDLDGDHDVDIAVAEMHTSKTKRILQFINDGDGMWRSQTLATTGSHNMQAADLDRDGDIDLIGKNYAGPDRTVQFWENLTRDNFGSVNPSATPYIAPGWRYVALDEQRDDDQRGKMGLVGFDANGDGRLDLAAGSFLYLNPGSDLVRPWKRIRLGTNVDTFFACNVDFDKYPDLIGARKNSLLWLEASDQEGNAWTERVIGQIPDARTQGYITAQIEAGGREELVFTRGTTLLYVRVPVYPENAPWPQVIVSTEAEEEGVGTTDIDGDQDLDIVAIRKGGQEVIWLENPGTSQGGWTPHTIGSGGGQSRWLDRVAIADINGDKRPDVVVTEETQDWKYNSSIYWFEAPKETHRQWQRHRISVLRSANSLDIGDVNGDGAPDVIVAEHTDLRQSDGAPNNLTVVFLNTGRGAGWTAKPIEVGSHSSHLGARVFDLDQDGRLDFVSLGWNQFRKLHLWWQRP